MNLKDKLNAELDSLVPKMSNEVYNAPFPSVTDTEEIKPSKTKKPFKTFLRIGLALAASLVILLSVLIPSLNAQNGKNYEPNSIVLLEVNPAIKIVSNDSGEIVSISSANEDADVIIGEDGLIENIKGKNIDLGLEILIEKCVEYGFINDSSTQNAIKVTVSNENGEKGKKLATDVNEKVSSYLKNKDINALLTVSSDSLDKVAEKLGFNYTSATDFISDVKNSHTLKTDEKLSQITEENYAESYKNNVIKYAKESVSSLYGGILSKINDLNDIVLDFEKIKNHKDNALSLEYFVIKRLEEFGEFTLTDSLKKLVDDTTTKISNFERKYGTVLDEINIIVLAEVYSKLNVNEIHKNMLDLTESIGQGDFDVESFKNSITAIVPDDDFKNQVNDTFSQLDNEPSSLEEYINKEKDALKKKAEDKKSSAKDYYEKIFQKNKIQLNKTKILIV